MENQQPVQSTHSSHWTLAHLNLYEMIEAREIAEAIEHLGAGPDLAEFTDEPRGHS